MTTCRSSPTRRPAPTGRWRLPARWTSCPSTTPSCRRSCPGPLRADVLFLSLPPAGPDGTFGLGLGADYPAALIGQARTVIAEINDQVPDVRGDRGCHRGEIDVLVHVSRPPPNTRARRAWRGRNRRPHRRPDPGRRDDPARHRQHPVGGRRRLRGHRDLGIHSGVITDAVADLIAAGVVTGARKSVDPGIVITGFLMGTRRSSRSPPATVRSSCATPATPTIRQFWRPSTGSWRSTRPPRST